MDYQLFLSEEALLARARTALGTSLRAYVPLPQGAGQLRELLDRNLVTPPAVYAAWLGSKRPADAAGLRLISTWALIAITQHAAGEVARRRGDLSFIGGYEIVERLAIALHDWPIAGVGTCQVERIETLDAAAYNAQGFSFAECRVTLAHGLAEGLDPADLDAFITFHAEYDIEPGDSQIDAKDTVTLPQ